GTLLSCLLLRPTLGASLSELVRTRFYEVLPVRGLCWLLLALCWAAFVIDLLVLVRSAYQQFLAESRPGNPLIPLIISAALVWPLYAWAKLVDRRLVNLPHIEPPGVNVKQAHLQRGIPAADLARLGAERFPNEVDPGRHADNVVRWCVGIAGVG